MPLSYFLNAHAFDIIHGTDTHRRDFTMSSVRPDLDLRYAVSWSSAVRFAFRSITKMIDGPAGWTFLDAGCGKGKAVLLWKLLLRQRGLACRTTGIELQNRFLAIAKDNHSKMFGDPGDWHCGDARHFDFAALSDRIILYFYNPFDAATLEELVTRARSSASFLVYNYPVHHERLGRLGYELVGQKLGKCPNDQTMIFRRTD